MNIGPGLEQGIQGASLYGIVALGVLEPKRWDRFRGLDITVRRMRDGALATVLTGRLADQDALFCVLLTLCDLELSLLAVARFGDGPASGDPDPGAPGECSRPYSFSHEAADSAAANSDWR